MAEWTTDYINDLPDSAFACIDPGGKKDEAGKTVPRSLRHYPHHNAEGAVDMPHLRNAMSRVAQEDTTTCGVDHLRAHAKAEEVGERANPQSEFEVRGTDLWPDTDFELRTTGDGLTLEGYAAVYDQPSMPIPGGPRGPFTEVIRPGAFSRTLARQPDVTLRYQHNLSSLPLARTRSGTLTLTDDSRGLHATANLPDNEIGRPVRDAIRRGDISGMSFRFRVPSRAGEKWSANYSQRELLDVALGAEISVVDFPAYPDTSVAVRHLAEAADLEPDDLAEAFGVLREPEARLTADQRDILMAAINTKVDAPYIPPKLAKARERLAALAS